MRITERKKANNVKWQRGYKVMEMFIVTGGSENWYNHFGNLFGGND